jgi:hypothetical protein
MMKIMQSSSGGGGPAGALWTLVAATLLLLLLMMVVVAGAPTISNAVQQKRTLVPLLKPNLTGRQHWRRLRQHWGLAMRMHTCRPGGRVAATAG